MMKIKYKDDMLKSEKGIVFCNWGRGEGKTQSIIDKIESLMEGGFFRIVLFTPDISSKELIRAKICNLFDSNIFNHFRGYKHDEFCYGNLDMRITYCKSIDEIRGINRVDYMFFDEYLPTYKEIKNIKNNFKNTKIYIFSTIDDIDYIYHRRQDDKKPIRYDNVDLIEKEINKLMLEISNIEINKENIRYREYILQQIMILKKINDSIK